MRIAIIIALALFVLCSASAKIPNRNLKDLIYERDIALRSAQQVRAAPVCQTYTCSKTGQSCNSTAANQFVCTDSGSACNGTTTLCATPKVLKLGQACNVNTDVCDTHLSCINGLCNGLYLPGTPCSQDYDCVYEVNSTNYITSCVNKQCYGGTVGQKCTQTSQCVFPLSCGPDLVCINPLPVGGMCDDDSDCAKGLLCSNNTCKQTLSAGAACNIDFDICGVNTACTPNAAKSTSGTCKEIYSGSSGSVCGSDLNCGEGLACNASTCVQIPNASNKPCTSDADCASYEDCECDGSGQQTCTQLLQNNIKGVKKATEDYQSCIDQCQENDIPCIAKNCKKQTCAYANFYLQMLQSIYSELHYPQCFIDYVSNEVKGDFYEAGFFTCSGSGSYVASSIVVLLLGVFIALLL